MAALPYMQFYVADYLADTVHLTAEEHGAYLLLIFNYWQTGKPLRADRLHRITGISEERWPKIAETLVEFFEVSGKTWVHHRIEEDLKRISESPRGKPLPKGESLKDYRGYIYFMERPDRGVIKVGYSKNPWARLAEVRRSVDDDGVEIVATLKTTEKSEVSVHAIYEDLRLDGEWFHKGPALARAVEAVASGVVTTVEELRSLRVAPVATTKADTDTYTETDQNIERDAHTHAYSHTPPPDWVPQETLPGQVRMQPGVDPELELLNFRAHHFERARPPSAWQGEWIKWLNKAKPQRHLAPVDDALERWRNGEAG